MHLMDQIKEAAHLADFTPMSTRSRKELISIYQIISDKLEGTPRFLFDQEAIGTAVELTLGRPKILYEVMQNLTIPYPRMWIEWEESGRERLRQSLAEAQAVDTHITPDRPLPDKVGFLLECDQGSQRCGKAIWAWSNKDAWLPSRLRRGPSKVSVPNIGPLAPYFDLDQQFRLQQFPVTIARLWKDSPVQINAISNIWSTCRHLPYEEWGFNYVAKYLSQPIAYEASLADTYGEYIMIWTTLILLTSSRPIIDRQPVSLKKLNRARLKRHEIPRLDYTEVTMYVTPESISPNNPSRDAGPTTGQARGPLLRPRKPPRIHIVSAYLARRGTKHWAVQPYWRGKGQVISRHTHVKRTEHQPGDGKEEQ